MVGRVRLVPGRQACRTPQSRCQQSLVSLFLLDYSARMTSAARREAVPRPIAQPGSPPPTSGSSFGTTSQRCPRGVPAVTDDQDAGGSGALEEPLSRCLSPPRIRHPVTSGKFRRSREDLSVAPPSECDGGDRPKTSAFCGMCRCDGSRTPCYVAIAMPPAAPISSPPFGSQSVRLAADGCTQQLMPEPLDRSTSTG